MKKILVSIIGILLVIVMVFVGFKYFRGTQVSVPPSAPQSDSQDIPDPTISEESLDIPAQEGGITEENEQFAAALKTVTGMDYNPINITSVGNPIRSLDFSYQINSWSMSKEYPGYPVPEGRDPLDEWPGAQLDENGNITNDFSYVVVNMAVENLTSKDVTTHVWGTFRLNSIGSGAGQYTGEVTYLGDDRPAGKDYYLDTISANSKKEMSLIFVIKDEYLNDNQLYIEVNPSGVATYNPDFDVKRYIFLD